MQQKTPQRPQQQHPLGQSAAGFPLPACPPPNTYTRIPLSYGGPAWRPEARATREGSVGRADLPTFARGIQHADKVESVGAGQPTAWVPRYATGPPSRAMGWNRGADKGPLCGPKDTFQYLVLKDAMTSEGTENPT